MQESNIGLECPFIARDYHTMKRPGTFFTAPGWHANLSQEYLPPHPLLFNRRYLQSWTKLLRHFTKFILIRGTITNVFNPPPPRQCCQCCCVVKTKSGELQTPRNNIERRRGGLNVLYPLVRQDIRGKCVIFLCLNHFCP